MIYYILQAHSLPPDDMKIRKVVPIDIANDPVKHDVSKNYLPYKQYENL